MKKFVTPGAVTGLLTVAAVAAGIAGKSELAAFLGSPDTANAVVSLVGAVGTLVAGLLPGLKAA